MVCTSVCENYRELGLGREGNELYQCSGQRYNTVVKAGNDDIFFSCLHLMLSVVFTSTWTNSIGKRSVVDIVFKINY